MAYPVFEGKGCYTEKVVCRKQKESYTANEAI